MDNLTPEIILANLHDQRWRLRNLYVIVDKEGRRGAFIPNDAQLKFLDEASGTDIILKARQLGFTTLMCIVGLDECLFKADWNVAIIAHTLNDANKIFETKVKFVYDNLPPIIRSRVTATNDRAGLLKFDNGSSIQVATSARSGTLQRLHVSEFGKICSQWPAKAREVVTGAFPAVGKNSKTLESTAEGQDGAFYRFCQEAMRGAGEFKFHFFPWWADPTYVADADSVKVTKQHDHYFATLKFRDKINLTPEQQAWWIKQEYLLGGDMKRENPATPQEAFEQAIEGAYFAAQLAHADKNQHIGRYPYDPRFPVNTFWDLGRNDFNAIWLHQRAGDRNVFIDYYENSGEYISHYGFWLEDWRREHEARWGDHYWPHDGKRQDLFLEHGRVEEAAKHGLTPIKIVRRPDTKMQAIDAARAVFASCDFDETACDVGIKRLRHYRKEWDDLREVWKDRPRHDDNSHGADAFMTFAAGFQAPSPYEDEFDHEWEYGRSATTGY